MAEDYIKFSRYEMFDLQLSPANGNQIVSIYEPGTDYQYSNLEALGYQLIRNGFIRDLRALVGVKSIAEITIPQDKLSDPLISKEMKSLIVGSLEWISERKHLKLWTGGINKDWKLKSTVSVVNRGAAPDYAIDLLAYFTGDLALPLGSNGRIGVSVENVNYGLLAGNDFINISGNYVEDVFALPPAEILLDGCIPEGWVIGTNSQIILGTDSNRKYFTLTNKSNSDIFINFGEEAILNKGIPLGPDFSFEYNKSIYKYRGPISAIASSANSLLCGMICK